MLTNTHNPQEEDNYCDESGKGPEAGHCPGLQLTDELNQ
jgi:hypothetical protein